MKIYLLYLSPKNKLYAITDNKKYLNRFLKERNSKLFTPVIKKINSDDGLKLLTDNKRLLLDVIPLEDSNGDCDIIGTFKEDNIINHVCEKMAEKCEYLKLHFMKNVPFNNEYKRLLDDLTTISKNINNHPIIQIDSVKLFYYLFKETFINLDQLDVDDVDGFDTDDIILKYKT